MTAEDTYKTIAEPSEGIYTEKRSKFIAIALPVRTLDEIKAHLETYQKKYYDARHVCYAYMLGAARKDFRANDNGEPSGTAGKPILGQINSNELTDILKEKGYPIARRTVAKYRQQLNIPVARLRK